MALNIEHAKSARERSRRPEQELEPEPEEEEEARTVQAPEQDSPASSEIPTTKNDRHRVNKLVETINTQV